MFRLWQFLRVKNVQIVLREFLLVVEGGLFLCVSAVLCLRTGPAVHRF